MKSAPILISRSAVATRKLCEMKRFNGYHRLHPDYDPTKQVGGIQPLDEMAGGFVKVRGQLIHGCLDLAIKGEDWLAWLSKQPPFMPEPFGTLQGREKELWLTLIRRVVSGWMDVRWSQLQKDYEPVSAEQEWQWVLHPLVAQSLRMDQIWRRRSDGHLLIVDFKTLAQPDMNWIDRLRNSDQTHLYIQALVERTQEPVLGIQYEGLLLGKKSTAKSDAFQWNSPWVNRWLKGGILQHKFQTGASHIWTLNLPDSDVVSSMKAENLYESQFVTTGPMYPPPNQLLQTRDATVEAEVQWADKIARLEVCAREFGVDSSEYESLLARLVERSSDACLKFGIGYACPYMSLCWDGQQPDPGSFQPRIDHHAEGSGD